MVEILTLILTPTFVFTNSSTLYSHLHLPYTHTCIYTHTRTPIPTSTSTPTPTDQHHRQKRQQELRLPRSWLFHAVILQSNPFGYRYRSVSVANFLGNEFKDRLDCEDLRCLQVSLKSQIRLRLKGIVLYTGGVLFHVEYFIR